MSNLHWTNFLKNTRHEFPEMQRQFEDWRAQSYRNGNWPLVYQFDLSLFELELFNIKSVYELTNMLEAMDLFEDFCIEIDAATIEYEEDTRDDDWGYDGD